MSAKRSRTIGQFDESRNETRPMRVLYPFRTPRTAWVRRVWKPALATANLDQDLGTHTLRRSQVALLIAQGVHPKVIADRLGHTSVRTVLDVYGHLYEGADEAAAERLESQIHRLIRGAGPATRSVGSVRSLSRGQEGRDAGMTPMA